MAEGSVLGCVGARSAPAPEFPDSLPLTFFAQSGGEGGGIRFEQSARRIFG